MTEQHPITPPPDLLQEWYDNNKTDYFTDMICAAQWGADQELEACLRLVEIDAGEDAYDFARYIRTARRPKPPSLKEEALDALEEIGQVGSALVRSRSDTIRKALEQLDD